MIKIGDWVEHAYRGVGIVIDRMEQIEGTDLKLVCVYYPHTNELHNAEYNRLTFKCSGGRCWNEHPADVMEVG